MSSVLNAMAKSVFTENGAISYSTTGFGELGCCLDYWSKAGTLAGREQSVVDADMAKIFADNAQVALAIVFGLRLITRKPKGMEETQTGYGRRDEFYKAIVWLHNNKPDLLYKNLHLIPVFGSWKDLVNEPLVNILDKSKVYELVSDNLADQLLLKYLPQIRSSKKSRSDRDKNRIAWAKGLCKALKIGFKDYRKLKSVGTAHIWQRQMQANQWDKIHFNGIPGKAMTYHTARKGKDGKTVFERHGLIERLTEWVLSQNSIKFTGYPYELTKVAGRKGNPSLIQKMIYNRQFETLIEPMKNHNLGNTLCALDTSGSMTWEECAPGVQPYDVCISMGVVFSSLNTGYFKDAVVAFDSTSSLVKLKGNFCERLAAAEAISSGGSTNFQSVIDLLVQTRKQNPNIPVEEYPQTLVVISDMQFNPTNKYGAHYTNDMCLTHSETNYEAAKRKLQSVGLGEMRIIWWWVTGRGADFPAQMNDKGVYMIGGFDPVNLKALMGLSTQEDKSKDYVHAEKKEETPVDGMKNFLSQPIFTLLQY